MTRSKLFTLWVAATFTLPLLGYVWPTFGAISAISMIVTTALLNSLLEINSPKLGRFTALLIGATTLASCVGAATTRVEEVALTLGATIAGYLFAAVAVRQTSDKSQHEEPRNGFKSGGGGDYGGGGASGKF